MKKYKIKSGADIIKIKGKVLEIVNGIVTVEDDFILPKSLILADLGFTDETQEITIENSIEELENDRDIISDKDNVTELEDFSEDSEDDVTFSKEEVYIDYDVHTKEMLSEMLTEAGVQHSKGAKKSELVDLCIENL